jgi:hypothetical protein
MSLLTQISSTVPRGLYNLGASCFMNVILQSFVQNPLLRNYFLSDRHHAALCPARENCLACELDKLFTEVSDVSLYNVGATMSEVFFASYANSSSPRHLRLRHLHLPISCSASTLLESLRKSQTGQVNMMRTSYSSPLSIMFTQL